MIIMMRAISNNILAVLQCIEESNGDALEAIAWAVVNRYAQLYPDYEVALVSLPIGDASERARSIENLLEYVKKTDSLG